MKLKHLLCSGVLACSLGAAMPALAATTLKVTLQLPLKHHLGQNLVDFKNEVESSSNGDIKIQIFPAAQLYKDKEVHNAVSSGAIEMGVISVTQMAGTIPAVDVFYVPFMFPTNEKVVKATEPGSPVRTLLDDEIIKTGARPLWWQAYGGVALLSKKKPIQQPDDMKGMKVRVFGKTLGEFAKSVGAAPTVMAGSEQFLAYQRGTVDAGMTGVTAVGPRKLYQVMDHLTLTNHANIEFMTLINEKTWQGLTDTERTILQNAALKVEKQLRDKIQSLEADAIAEARNEMNVIDLTPEDIAKWQEATRPVLKSFIENAGPLGEQVIEAANAL
ncbi:MULTISPECIES: TRAP transporter substrate-binding protein [Marinobacter]|uniref:TRAP transporter substrate-binding protein DctP n=1 Tax=Marinobacter xiaoshiensis TaxID=3073652 RepID=A0ABU2HH32_9GAMM|nr:MULTISPECIES: TRAP transporter substrate-binding protein DctP [unclassified Marinobacter]MBK1874554.1 TRAP transporter substrate-binding protein DctP [Marinobacter sp. 1-3A]MBK1887814.1 TRAP transporter substrate-binding protein DctP [Marinobacter sp. DY40_1A1]MDS1310379.1 TRAP transporter substrate-binding protein DctP [Marinobacter sp. F60267]